VKTDVTTIIPTRETVDNPRFPAVEHILGTMATTHDCTVTVVDEDHRRRKFVVFFKYDKNGIVNGALKETAGLIWKGEILVMKQGERSFVTGIAGKQDQTLAIQAVHR
jgi:hypothetical protein